MTPAGRATSRERTVVRFKQIRPKIGKQQAMDQALVPVITTKRVADICRDNDIVFLGVFGSFARGDFNKESDVDLLVRFSQPKSLPDLVRIERHLSERLGRRVDLVTEGSVSPYLRDRINAEVKTVYAET